MDLKLFEQLRISDSISEQSLENIRTTEKTRLFSLHWEVTTILYLGVLLLTTGAGILVYKNIDSIGHEAILIFIGIVCAGSFTYCLKKKTPFSPGKVESPTIAFDYILLLACLLLLTFIGYLQFQYEVFGTRFGLATFIPMIILFFCAYYFDHLGILALAIVNLCAWAGIAVTPMKILKENDFDNHALIATGMALGTGLIAVALVTKARQLKNHFSFTYLNFGIHSLFISTLAGLMVIERFSFLFLLLLSVITFLFYKRAVRDKSFYEMVILTLYFYTGISYQIIYLLFSSDSGMGGIYVACLYFITSGTALIMFLIRMNKKLQKG